MGLGTRLAKSWVNTISPPDPGRCAWVGHETSSLVPRPFPPPVFDRILYAKTGAGMAWERGYETRLIHGSSFVPRPWEVCVGGA